MIQSAVSAVTLWLGAGMMAVAAETNAPPRRPMTLEACIELALAGNLDLRIERINPSLRRLDLELARAGYDPNFLFSASHSYAEAGGRFFTVTNLASTNLVLGPNIVSKSDRFGSGISGLGPYGLTYDLSGTVSDHYGSSDGSVGLSLIQPLLRDFLIDGTRYNIAVARNRLKSSELQLRQQLINTITDVEQAYYEVMFRRDNVQVQTEGLSLAQRAAADDRKRVQIGMLPRLDEKKSEAEVYTRQSAVTTALRELAGAQNTLKRLLTSDYRDLHEVMIDPTGKLTAEPRSFTLQDLHESWRIALEQRPDLQQARLDIERQGITLKYYKNQLLPALDVSGSYGHGASGARTREFSDAFGDFSKGNRPFWSIGSSIGIPLANKAARERYRAGKLTAEQLLLSLKQKEESALVDIDEAQGELQKSLANIESSSKARAYAEDALTAEQKKLESGKSTSYAVLQFQRDLTSARVAEIRALADYNKAVAELSRREGTTLERKKINVEVK